MLVLSEVCFGTKTGTFWEPNSTKHASFWYTNFGGKPKMAQNALSAYSDPHTISAKFGLVFQNW